MKQAENVACKQKKAQQIYRDQLNKKKLAKKEKRDTLLFILCIGLGCMALAIYETFLR